MEHIVHEAFTLLATDSKAIPCHQYLPQEEPKALVLMVHGFGEHQGRYQDYASFMVNHGFAVYTLDQRGHGLSNGTRGHIPGFSQLFDDVELLMMHAREAYNEVPLFLLGHSWGGNVVANFLLSKPVVEIRAAVLSSPWLRLAFQPPAGKVKLARIVGKLLPGLTQPADLDVSFISRDPKQVKAYQDDPLVHGKISVRTFLQTLEYADRAIAKASELKVPVLVMHGTADQITDMKASQEFVFNASENASFLPLEGRYHEAHNDYDNAEVYQHVLTFFEKYI